MKIQELESDTIMQPQVGRGRKKALGSPSL